MTGRVRILPMMIIVLALLFSVKLGNIWHGASTVDFGGGINVQPAMAQQSNEGQADSDSSGGGAPPGSTPLQETDVETPVLGDPNRFSEREVQLLQELAERRTVLDARQQRLEEREVLLKAADQRLVEKQTELTSTKEELSLIQLSEPKRPRHCSYADS